MQLQRGVRLESQTTYAAHLNLRFGRLIDMKTQT